MIRPRQDETDMAPIRPVAKGIATPLNCRFIIMNQLVSQSGADGVRWIQVIINAGAEIISQPVQFHEVDRTRLDIKNMVTEADDQIRSGRLVSQKTKFHP